MSAAVRPRNGTLGELCSDLSNGYDTIENEDAIGRTWFVTTKVRDSKKLVDEIGQTSSTMDERLPYRV